MVVLYLKMKFIASLFIIVMASVFVMLGCTVGSASNVDQVPYDSSLIAAYDTLKPFKTAVMLDEAKYWEIIDRSLTKTSGQEEQQAFLVREIKKMAPKEMVGFRLRTDKLLSDSYRAPLWCAAYIMNNGCSDDGFEYFRCWLISRGKNVYHKALADPDLLVKVTEASGAPYEFEAFWYVVLQAFESTTGKQLYDYIDEDAFKTKEGNHSEIKLTWREDEPETMRKICPKLYKKFME